MVMSKISDAGRNELCPCGSRKKYKKCCGLKKRSSRSATITMLLVGLLLAVGVIAGITAITSDRRDVGRPGGVWSPEHGHYH
jgi:SEC-C motif